MMNLIFDEKVLQSEQMENQITILHSAIKQQKQEHERHLKVKIQNSKGVIQNYFVGNGGEIHTRTKTDSGK